MGRWSRLVAAGFLDWLDAPAGARWLDLCCGGGALTDAILVRCRPAIVRGIDLSPAQIQFARQQCAHPAAAFYLGDAIALPFRSKEFDLCVSGLGLNYVSDAIAALREMDRVTRPRGTVAAYVWDYAGKMRFLREFWDVALAVDPEAAAFDQGRRFPICSPEGLRAAFQAAGFAVLAARNLDIATHFASFDEYWAGFQLFQGSAPIYLASRRDCIREAIRDGLQAALPVQPDGSILLRARALAMRAQRS
jgi:SAM-dependent methyltransferase